MRTPVPPPATPDDDFQRKHQRLMDSIRAQDAMDDDAPPIVPLDAYFDGNPEEESIAPNQWGYGRPPLAQLWARFREIAERPEVQLVLVGIHDDWREWPEEWPPAENVHIYTTAPAHEVEQWIDGLAADGVIAGWPYGQHLSAPELLPGHAVLSVCWD